jgi:hypothetical protein
MPCLPTLTRSRVLEWLVLETTLGDSDRATVLEQKLAVRRDEMRHGPVEPDMTVQPKPAVHGVDHSVSALLELTKWGDEPYWQFSTPSVIAGASGGALPKKMAQVSG